MTKFDVAKARTQLAHTSEPVGWRTYLSTACDRIEELEAALERIRALVDEQAEEPALWDIADSVVEAFLQQELRRLHAEVHRLDPRGT